MIWFTSDLHLSHYNSIAHNNRPYSSVQQMNEELIKHWNNRVQPNDVIYVLGDFCWGWNSQQIQQTLDKLNGIKYLIYGNHDKLGPHRLANRWVEIVPYKEINIGNDFITMCHYPMAEWNCCYRGSYHLYGHCHGKFDLANVTKDLAHHNTKCMDVGVDANNYMPISWDEIKQKL